MKNIKLTLLGTAALLIAVGLNIRHALNDYGVRDNKLHVEVLAQSNGSGGGGSTDEGGGSTDDYHDDYVLGYYLKPISGGVITVTCQINGEISIIGITIKGSYSKGSTYTIAWSLWSCEDSKDPKSKCKIADQGIRIGAGSGTTT